MYKRNRSKTFGLLAFDGIRRHVFFNTDPGTGGGGGGGGAPAAAAPTAGSNGASVPTTTTTASMGGESVTATTTLPAGGAPAAQTTTTTDTGADWKAGLGDLAKNPTIANVKSIQDLANMALNGEQEIGRLRQQAGAQAPAADAKLEDVSKYMQGRYAPKDAKDYGLDARPEGLPDGIDFKPEAATEFAAFAQSIGLHPAQAKAMQGFAAKLATAEQAQRAEAASKLTETYKTKWGADYEKRVDLNGRLLTQHLGPEDVQKLQALPADARALMAFALDSIREKYVTDDTITPPTDASAQGQSGKTLAQLQQEMHALQSDPAYFNRQADPAKHETLRKQITALSAQIAQFKGGTR